MLQRTAIVQPNSNVAQALAKLQLQRIRGGTSEPVDATGNDGDFWLNLSTGTVRQRTNGSYYGPDQPLICLKGTNATTTADANPNQSGLMPSALYSKLFAMPSIVAPLDSPAMTGTPTAPTPGAADSSTQLATTQWTQARIASLLSTYASASSLSAEVSRATTAESLKVDASALGTAAYVSASSFATAADGVLARSALQAQIQADWNATSGAALILHKPPLFSGSYLNLSDRPTIPAAQVQSDWTAATGVSAILNKPTLGTAASMAASSFASATDSRLALAASALQSQTQADWNATTGVALILNKPTFGSAAFVATTMFATAAQGALAAQALQPAALGTTVQPYSATIPAAYLGTTSTTALRGDTLIPTFPKYTINLVPGTVTLGTKELTVTVAGLLATDQVVVQPNVAMPAGLSIGSWRISAANTLVVQVQTAIAAGLVLGTNSYACTVTVLK